MRGVPVLLKRGTPRTANRDRVLQRIEQRGSGIDRPQSARIRGRDERRSVIVKDTEPIARDRPGGRLPGLPNFPAPQPYPTSLALQVPATTKNQKRRPREVPA